MLVRHVPGDPARPTSQASLKEKFDRLVAPVLGEKATSPLWRTAVEASHSTRRPVELLQQLDKIIHRISAD